MYGMLLLSFGIQLVSVTPSSPTLSMPWQSFSPQLPTV